jgi:NADH:ubiquinone oxidoreductase subunit 6 (subunit J)
MVFLIVYIGAIAVLFLFVIYMLNLKIIELNESNLQYLIGIIISFFLILLILIYSYILNDIFFIEKGYFISNYNTPENHIYIEYQYKLFNNNNNILLISMVLYNNNYIYFIVVSLILLVAMIGVIILTSNKTFFLKEQVIFEQIKRFIKI